VLTLAFATASQDGAPYPGAFFIETGKTGATTISALTMDLVGGGPAPSASIALRAANANVTLGAGASASVDVTVANTGGAAGSYNLSASGAPEGVTVAFDGANGSVDANASKVVKVTFTASKEAAPGSYDVSVQSGDARLPLKLTITSGGTTPTTTPPSGGPSGGTTTSGSAGSTTSNGDAGSAQSTQDTKKKGLPGPEVFGVLAALMIGLVVVARRRA